MDKKTLNNQVNYLETLQKLTSAYAEISSSRMKKVRGSVLSARDFLESLNEIFQEVRKSYRKEVMQLSKKKGDNNITFLSHNGKTVAVFLSANTGLYGELMQKTFNKFMHEVENNGSEATIIGRLGLSLYLGRKPNAAYTYFDYPDYGSDKQKLSEVVRHLVQYEAIHLYYGKFHNVISQEPEYADITAESSINEEQEGVEEVKYIFEPTLEEILMFFETEMFSSVFEQALIESQLAKFASRMLAMDRASQNIRESLRGVQLSRLKMNHRIANKKQLNAVSSLFANGFLSGGISKL